MRCYSMYSCTHSFALLLMSMISIAVLWRDMLIVASSVYNNDEDDDDDDDG